jgi:hypothetical protein
VKDPNPDERLAWRIFWTGIALFAAGVVTSTTGFLLHIQSTLRVMRRIESSTSPTPADLQVDLGSGWSITIVGIAITVLGALWIFVACVRLWMATRSPARTSNAWA